MDDALAFLGTYSVSQPEPPGSDDDDSLEQLIHLNTRILNSKLEVLSFLLVERVGIHDRNIDRIDTDKGTLDGMVRRITRDARYHLREHDEKRILYQKFFELEEERRKQDVECWRDVVQVMRDFLYIWDAHEHAKSRAIFLEHAGT